MKKLIKLVIFLLVPAVLLVLGLVWKYKPILITQFFQSKEYSRNLYKDALELQQNKEYRDAYYTYGKISGNYKIFDIVLFQQADCAANIEDEKTAAKKYQKILSSYPDSPLAALASYKLGQTYIRLKQDIEAEKAFEKTIKDYPGTDYALGSFYYLGELNKNKDRDMAIQYWQKYIALAPKGDFAVESIEGLKKLNHIFTEKDMMHAGIALYMHQKYKEALTYLNQLPEKDGWYYRAFCQKQLGQRRTAAYAFMEGIENYFDTSMSSAKMRYAMKAYVTLSRHSRYQAWSNVLRWTDKEKDFALYHKAGLLSLKKAKSIYEEIYKNYPKGDYASESLWKLMWYEYDKGSYDKALELGEKHLETYRNTNATPAVIFWLGKIQEKKNNYIKAERYYKKVLEAHTDSYYAYRAKGRLENLKGKPDIKWATDTSHKLPTKQEKPELPFSYQEMEVKHGVHTAELILLEDYDTAVLLMPEDLFLESWIKLQKGILTSSIVSARNGMKTCPVKPNDNNPCWNLIYPIYYPEEINKNAELNSIDPVLVLSLMKEESHFNPYAVSSVGARGLMQVMPATAREVIRWKRLGRYNKTKLFDPAVNIKIGTAYLGFADYIFNGDMLYSVAAYNAGPTAVQTWQKRLSTKDLDQFIENIPYRQTRDYVKKVFGTYWNYTRIYDFE